MNMSRVLHENAHKVTHIGRDWHISAVTDTYRPWLTHIGRGLTHIGHDWQHIGHDWHISAVTDTYRPMTETYRPWLWHISAVIIPPPPAPPPPPRVWTSPRPPPRMPQRGVRCRHQEIKSPWCSVCKRLLTSLSALICHCSPTYTAYTRYTAGLQTR